jgi:branched-chain amino acid transport system permease protein
MFIALSHNLFDMLTLGFPVAPGVAALIGAGALAGLVGAALTLSSTAPRLAVISGISAVVVAGVFQELIQLMLRNEGPIGDIVDFFYDWEGLTQQGAAAIFVATAIASQFRAAAHRRNSIDAT